MKKKITIALLIMIYMIGEIGVYHPVKAISENEGSAQEERFATEPTVENAFSVSTHSTLGNYIYGYDVSIGGTDVVIPETIGGKKIDTISQKAFQNKGLTSVYIPDGVREIGANAFQNNSIKEIRLPETLTTIGANAFVNNLIEILVLPNSVNDMGNSAFANCNITSLTISNNLNAISASAFKSNKLTEVVIPESVTEINISAFQANLSLQKVTLSDNLETIGTYAFQQCRIDDLYIGNKLISIGDSAFDNNQITTLKLPDSLTEIKGKAFSNNSIKELVIPNSVRSLGVEAFQVNNISSLTIGNEIQVIPDKCFSQNSLKSINLPSNVTKISSNAFNGNQLLSFDLPDTVTELASDAFGLQRILTGLSMKNGSYIKRMNQIYDDTQLTKIVDPKSSWGTYDVNSNSITLSKNIGNGTILKYFYHIENNTIQSDTALEIWLDSNRVYDYYVVFKDSNTTVLKEEYVTHGQSATAPNAPTPPTSDLSFAGWDQSFDNVTGELVVTATYDQRKHNVSFKEVDDTIISTANVVYENLVTKPADPTKEGYTFVGWFKDKDLQTAWNFATDKIIGDTDIYAKWEAKEYTITYNGLEGTTHSNLLTYTIETANITLTDPTNREGYTFEGWFDGVDTGTTKVTQIPTGSTGNITLYAHWSINEYTVSYKEVNGSVIDTVDAPYDSVLTEPTALTKEGYTFKGWFKDQGLQTAWNFATDKIIGDTDIYAKWEAKEYTITYNGLEGTTHSNPNTYTIETPTITLADPTDREGYIFEGWYDGNNKVTKIVIGSTGDMTLTAKWVEDVKKITVNIIEEKINISRVYKSGVNTIDVTNSHVLNLELKENEVNMPMDFSLLEWEAANIAGFENYAPVVEVDETTGKVIGLKSGVAKVTVKLKEGYDENDPSTYDTCIVIIPGDVNKDGKVSSIDSILIDRVVATLDTVESIQGNFNKEYLSELMDMDGNGSINAMDIMKSKRMTAKLDVPSN